MGSCLGTLLGTSTAPRAPTRTNLVLEATGRQVVRSGDWLLIPPYPGKAINEQVNLETGLPVPQLYNLRSDPGQRRNRASEQPTQLAALQRQMQQIVGSAYRVSTEPALTRIAQQPTTYLDNEKDPAISDRVF